MTHHRPDGVVTITGARPSRFDEVRHRQHRYMLTMAIRTVCVILAIVLWQESRPVAVVALVCGGVLPYIAVVYANAREDGGEQPPDAFVPHQAPRSDDGPPGPGGPPDTTGRR
ncbi:DUF3099 domain-containing protein [Streptacidiphilus sp. PB12-B1b]|nr:DUF3099 domain-containing protein [Streptacidiphilus sp. PB12-B1b]